MANKRNGILYVGVTSCLATRVWAHREGISEGFTKKYNVNKLVYYEEHEDMYSAITREKQIKQWSRKWKLRLIERHNPDWKDLYGDVPS